MVTLTDKIILILIKKQYSNSYKQNMNIQKEINTSYSLSKFVSELFTNS